MSTETRMLPKAGQLPKESGSWATFPAFMETQFPVSKVSKESYKERKANNSQTLTGLGKWWGRKPLVLVRATILGLLLPSTDDPNADRETFLGLMTMDDDGMLLRLDKSLTAALVFQHCTTHERTQHFDSAGGKLRWKKSTAHGERDRLQRLAFLRMGYDERLQHCVRPEQIDGPSTKAWERFNAHLNTNAHSIPELVRELGQRRFGHVPRVGDAFCGGGSIPFEAARIGCDAYASDLNPVAALLTWGAFHIIGGGPDLVARVEAAQRRVYEAVRSQVDEWGIERSDDGWVADAYLYCNEVLDPRTGWRVPLAPSWVIGQRTKTIVRLVPREATKSFDFEVVEGASQAEVTQAREEGTWRAGITSPVDEDGHWLLPTQRVATSIEQVRGRTGLRLWENDDLVPQPSDVFHERLYCVRWAGPDGQRRYAAPTSGDSAREERVLELLRERFGDWQARGLIPSTRIEVGEKTEEPIRTRGWTHWHHLFNPRQLLIAGLVAEAIEGDEESEFLLHLTGRLADWNSRLCIWDSSVANEKGANTLYNQALNPQLNYSCRPIDKLATVLLQKYTVVDLDGATEVQVSDARDVIEFADLWFTDPGYADSIAYAELSEFFLSWYARRLSRIFPTWYGDSKRSLAVEGAGDDFRKAMVDCYTNLAQRMPDNGFQVVTFTHQDAEVWADLALIMWAAGLRVSAAWTVATETDAGGFRAGNYVQGTVVLILRRRLEERPGSMTDLYPDLRAEVEAQLASMGALDDKEDPNFTDADYQLAAYAAALRVLTAYSSIDEISIERELGRPTKRGEKSPLVALIDRAVKLASDYLVPDGLDRNSWKNLSAIERFYLKGVEVESHGERRQGVYQEYARGYGAGDYRALLASAAANEVRLKTPSEFKARDLGSGDFGGTLVRHLLFAVYKTAEAGDPRVGREYLRSEIADYWEQRQLVLALLTFLAQKPKPEADMSHWTDDVEAARLLRGSIENESL